SACLPREGRLVGRYLAAHGRSRSSARGQGGSHARIGRDDRAMARAAMNTGKAENGAAIVMAMLLAALAAVIGATLLWQQQRWIGEHERRRDQVQAQALAMAGVQWARQIVFENAPAGQIVHLGQPWALKLPPMPIENGSIGGYIADAQGRLNV